MAIDIADAESRLWAAADKLWANTGLKPSEFSTPVLGLIFLRYSEARFVEVQRKYLAKGTAVEDIEKYDYQAEGVMFLPDKARFSTLLKLAEADNLGKALNDAMAAIEAENEDLKGVLPRAYTRIENWVLVELLRLLAPVEIEGDAFGQIYEYFLGNFALKEGQKGGVFYTPTSIVKLIVEIIEPFHGRIFDPACGSGDIRQSNTYYEDPHQSAGKFDFVMANPPFNVSGVDKERIKGDPRFPLGMPNTDNANYLWISLFWSTLNEKGRAGFVMANSAGDARGSEMEIRKKLIQSGAVDVIVAIGSNFFYTVTLPCTLWFLDNGKRKTARKDQVLFIDARGIYRQIDRAHRDFQPEQVEFLANIARLYRGEQPETMAGSQALMDAQFPDGAYRDIAGVCKLATRAEIEAQGWSLNPGRYVGAIDKGSDGVDFAERLEELSEELEVLNAEARELEDRISVNISALLASA